MSVCRPLVIELFCGSFGWSAGFIAEGWRAIGVDIEHLPHHGPVPENASLILQDVRTLQGSQFKDADAFACSPPCQKYSYMAMPWSRGKAMAAEIRNDFYKYSELNYLFAECFRIQMEACRAAGRYIPIIIENVRGAQEWVGRSKWHYGSFYLWGDVPALMPITNTRKVLGTGTAQRGDKLGLSAVGFNVMACRQLKDGQKTANLANIRDGHSHTRHLTNQSEHYGVKLGGNNAPRNWKDREVQRLGNAPIKGQDGGWFNDKKRAGQGETGYLSRSGSKSSARKAASATIARIPFLLAQHIARCFKP